MTRDEAIEVINQYQDRHWELVPGNAPRPEVRSTRNALRTARRRAHPDAGGSRDAWDRVEQAGRVLGLS